MSRDPEEVAAVLPPLTDEQVQRVALLLALAPKPTPDPEPVEGGENRD